MPEIFLLIMAIAPFIGALATAFLPRDARMTAVGISLFVALAGIICAALLYPAVAAGPVSHTIEWMPTLGLNIILRLDGLSWVFSLLILTIGLLVIIYARYYISPQDPVARFFSFLLAFMGAMLGVVMSGNLIQLVLFWELTSLFSFLLIGYWHHAPQAREGARMALTVTATGGLCLLLGSIILGTVTGSYELSIIRAAGDLIRDHELYLPILILILLGALTKSAQFPFFFWLPQAMSAPTPVSAYLHSATMVKAGIFLLMQLWPVLSGTDAWLYIVGGAGLITLITGAYIAIFQHDLKGLLAYSTISHLGLITLLLGLSTPLALTAAIFHTLNHATFKASLFMAVGVIDHETGTRDMRVLSGLLRFMPFTGCLAMVATAAMAGVPLLNGFLSKEMFLSETIGHDALDDLSRQILPILATCASIFSVMYSLRFIHQTFFGPAPQDFDRIPHEPVRWMRFPIEILVLVCLLVGIFPENIISPFLDIAVFAVLGADAPSYSLSIWHGFNPAFFMSLTALCGGTALYLMFKFYINANSKGTPLLTHFHGTYVYNTAITALTLAATKLENLMGTARLQIQLRAVIITTIIATFLALAHYGPLEKLPHPGRGTGTTSLIAFTTLWLIAGICALTAAYQAKFHRFLALILIGAVGLVCSASFAWLSAPDLAITQLLVEIVTAIMLLLGLRWLPKRDEAILTPRAAIIVASRRSFDIALAFCAGLGMTILSYAVMTRPLSDPISRFFIENSYAGGGGRNVVNVLLVDFRAFDTLGEITVLGIVGVTVYALLRRFRPAADTLALPPQQKYQSAIDAQREDNSSSMLDDYLLFARPMVKCFFPAMLLLAIYLLLRGHDMPGGGFAAGIIISIAFVLQYMAFGVRWTEAHLFNAPKYWLGAGLLLALFTGAAAILTDHPFLTSYFSYAELPLLGKLPVASALLFDIGVCLLVVGATMLTMIALAHQTVRKPRTTTGTAQNPHPEGGL